MSAKRTECACWRGALSSQPHLHSAQSCHYCRGRSLKLPVSLLANNVSGFISQPVTAALSCRKEKSNPSSNKYCRILNADQGGRQLPCALMCRPHCCIPHSWIAGIWIDLAMPIGADSPCLCTRIGAIVLHSQGRMHALLS